MCSRIFQKFSGENFVSCFLVKWNRSDTDFIKAGLQLCDDKLKLMKNWETIASVWELYNAVQCVYIHTFVCMYTQIHLKLREVKGFQHRIQKSKLIQLSQRRIGRQNRSIVTKGKKREKSWQAEFPTDHCQIIYILCHHDTSFLRGKEEFKLFNHI